MDLLIPRSPSSTLLLHTQKQCTARGPLGCLPSLSLTTKGSWIHLLGEGRQASRQLSDASTPVQKLRETEQGNNKMCNYNASFGDDFARFMAPFFVRGCKG